MDRILSILRYLNVLSIDVVLGACINAWLIAYLLPVELPLISILCLGLSVWLIYTADHLIDARKIRRSARSTRHRFHQRFFLQILLFFLLIAAAGSYLVFLLPSRTLLWGFFLILCVVLYLAANSWLQWNISYLKELIVAFLYASGIFMVPLSIHQGFLNWLIPVLFFQLTLLALLNLLIFSHIERGDDQKDGLRSIITLLSAKKAQLIIYGISISIIISSLTLICILKVDKYFFSQLIYLSMALVLLFTYTQKKLHASEKYRLIGDWVFLFPIVLIFVDG